MEKKISLTRALAEIKLIEKKLESRGYIFDAVIKGKLQINSHLTKEELLKNSKSHLQSIKDLFDKRRLIKAKIAEANINTKVEVNGSEMSIIEAIDYKSSSSYLLNQLNDYKNQYTSAKNIYDKALIKIENEVNEQTSNRMGSASQVPKDLVDTLTDTYTKLYGAEIISDITLEQINETIKTINDTIDEIDMCLSEVNSKTEITIEG